MSVIVDILENSQTSSAVGTLYLRVKKNGSSWLSTLYNIDSVLDSAVQNVITFERIVALTAADYIELYLYSGGGDLQLAASAQNRIALEQVG